jgi:hypothetical protein
MWFIGVLALAALLVIPAVGKDKKKQSKSQHEHDYAVMVGNVYNKGGRPVYGTKIRIRKLDQKNPKYELISDHNGEFAQRVPPGPADYVLWVDTGKHSEPTGEQVAAMPAQTAEHGPVRGTNAVRVHVEKDERIDIGLHPQQ